MIIWTLYILISILPAIAVFLIAFLAMKIGGWQQKHAIIFSILLSLLIGTLVMFYWSRTHAIALTNLISGIIIAPALTYIINDRLTKISGVPLFVRLTVICFLLSVVIISFAVSVVTFTATHMHPPSGQTDLS